MKLSLIKIVQSILFLFVFFVVSLVFKSPLLSPAYAQGYQVYLFNDANYNKVLDQGETALTPQVSAIVTYSNNASNPYTITSSNGILNFGSLSSSGSYLVSLSRPAGYTVTNVVGTSGFGDFTITNGVAQDTGPGVPVLYSCNGSGATTPCVGFYSLPPTPTPTPAPAISGSISPTSGCLDTTSINVNVQGDNGVPVDVAWVKSSTTWVIFPYQKGTSPTFTVPMPPSFVTDIDTSLGTHELDLIVNPTFSGQEITSDDAIIPVSFTNTACPTPTATPTLTPTLTLTPTQTPFPTLTPTGTVAPSATPTNTPTLTPSPTPTPMPNDTILSFTVSLTGIGTAGDNTDPTNSSLSNKSPQRTTRTIQVDAIDSTGHDITGSGTVTYDANSGTYQGTVNFMNTLPTNTYTIKVKSDSYLRKTVAYIQNITQGVTNNLPPVTLIAGDVNNDNTLSIVDYGLILDCYSDLAPATNCNSSQKLATDLNDDANVNGDDVNLFLRNLGVQNGD